MKRSVVSSLLLWGLALPVTWVAIFFTVGLQTHRAEIKHKMNEGHLTLKCFTLTPQQLESLEWEHDREFKFKGAMYDVQKIFQKKGRIEIWAYEDIGEGQWIAYFTKSIKKAFGKGENQDRQVQLVDQWLKSLCLPPDIEVLSGAYHFVYSTQLMPYINHYHFNTPHPIFHPPCNESV